MPFRLEALQANDGDCLLLHYPGGVVLIDGGSRGVYTGFLRKRLEQLRGSSPALDLRLVMVSHIDADHITGVLDMFRELSEGQADGISPRYRVRSLWHNSFDVLTKDRAQSAMTSSVVAAAAGGTAVPAGLTREVEAVMASVAQGNDLRRYANTLTRINRETRSAPVMAPARGAKTIRIDRGLTFTILGPHETELDKLEDSWKESRRNQPTEEAAAADYLNRTVPNLSSIVVLAESGGRRMLLTGDAGGDLILKGLDSAGLLGADGRIHVDLLKVQHHGSNHSVDIGFFRAVTADHYVISGNGKHGIPHGDTLAWLSEARDGESYDVYMTNRTGEGLTEMLDDFLAGEAAHQPLHRYHFRDEAALSIVASVAPRVPTAG